MASIYNVTYPSGRIITRIQFKSKRAPVFSLSFDDWSSACKWVEDNEEKYYADPEVYIDWKHKTNQEMRRDHKKTYLHMIASKVKRNA